MNAFDHAILEWAASLSGTWPRFDLFLTFVSANNLFKGFLVMCAIWWLWFREQRKQPGSPDAERVREQVMATLLAGLVALVVARVLANELPFRARPLALPEFADAFQISRPRLSGLDEWSSFPSDHATLFAALAAGAWFACRSMGVLLMVYSFVVILLPRIYLGMHYPTDILAGALIGIAIAWGIHLAPVRGAIARPFVWWQMRSPGTFYAIAFLLTSQIAVLFDPVRHVARFAADLAGAHAD
jgi:membrane-associated phospholipid phosphatase